MNLNTAVDKFAVAVRHALTGYSNYAGHFMSAECRNLLALKGSGLDLSLSHLRLSEFTCPPASNASRSVAGGPGVAVSVRRSGQKRLRRSG